MATIQDFAKLEMEVAQVLEVRDHPNADKLLVMKIDIGGETRQIVAGLRGHYTPDDLTGKKIVAVTNLEPVKLRGEESHGMLLAALEGDRVVILVPDKDVTPGSAVE